MSAADFPNEMLQDPAIIMTSKNPSLSNSRPRYRYNVGQQILKSALADHSNLITNGMHNAATQAGPRSTKRRTPRKKKNRSPKKHDQGTDQVQELRQSSVEMVITPDGQENQSNPKKSRRIFKSSTKQQQQPRSASPISPKSLSARQVSNRTPSEATTTAIQQPLQQRFAQIKSASNPLNAVASAYRQFPAEQLFPGPRYITSRSLPLNPFAQSFVPRFSVPKPGTSSEFVSREIVDYYQRNRQTNEQFKSKQIMRQGLESILKHAFPHHCKCLNLFLL